MPVNPAQALPYTNSPLAEAGPSSCSADMAKLFRHLPEERIRSPREYRSVAAPAGTISCHGWA